MKDYVINNLRNAIKSIMLKIEKDATAELSAELRLLLKYYEDRDELPSKEEVKDIHNDIGVIEKKLNELNLKVSQHIQNSDRGLLQVRGR